MAGLPLGPSLNFLASSAEHPSAAGEGDAYFNTASSETFVQIRGQWVPLSARAPVSPELSFRPGFDFLKKLASGPMGPRLRRVQAAGAVQVHGAVPVHEDAAVVHPFEEV